MREVQRIVTARRHRAGTGIVGRRALPTSELGSTAPFSLLEEIGPTDGDDGDTPGAFPEPQRGVEVITLIMAGELQFSYSSGDRGLLRADDVLWTVAGAGTGYSEIVARSRVHGLRFHVDMPAHLEKSAPRWSRLRGGRIPWLPISAAVQARVLAGEGFGVRAVIETGARIQAQDLLIDAGADVTVPMAEHLQAMAYVSCETAWLGDEGLAVRQGQLALLGPGTAVRLRGAASTLQPARLLLLAGVPHPQRVDSPPGL